jgi:hypothetical protein
LQSLRNAAKSPISFFPTRFSLHFDQGSQAHDGVICPEFSVNAWRKHLRFNLHANRLPEQIHVQHYSGFARDAAHAAFDAREPPAGNAHPLAFLQIRASLYIRSAFEQFADIAQLAQESRLIENLQKIRGVVRVKDLMFIPRGKSPEGVTGKKRHVEADAFAFILAQGFSGRQIG